MKDNPYFEHEEVDRSDGEFIGRFSSEGVKYPFTIKSREDNSPLITIERDSTEKKYISETAIQLLYDKIRLSYEGYIINKHLKVV